MCEFQNTWDNCVSKFVSKRKDDILSNDEQNFMCLVVDEVILSTQQIMDDPIIIDDKHSNNKKKINSYLGGETRRVQGSEEKRPVAIEDWYGNGSVAPLKEKFYLNCERCNNTVSANTLKSELICGEYCNGCSSVICYECIPDEKRFCRLNLGSKRIEVRNYSDRRCNQIINSDYIKKYTSKYCEKCAFENLKNGKCMVQIKEWYKRKHEKEMDDLMLSYNSYKW
jgi:hypothetical protein